MSVADPVIPDGYQRCPHCRSLIPEGATVCRRCTRDLRPSRPWRDPKTFLAVATGAAGFFSALGVIWLYANLVQPFAGPVIWIKDAKCWHDKAVLTIVNTGSRSALIDSLNWTRKISVPGSDAQTFTRAIPFIPALSIDQKAVHLVSINLEETKNIDGSVLGSFPAKFGGPDKHECRQELTLNSIMVPQGSDSLWDGRIFRKRERGIPPKLEPRSWGPDSCTCMVDQTTDVDESVAEEDRA